jgi:hypothetical protein
VLLQEPPHVTGAPGWQTLACVRLP